MTWWCLHPCVCWSEAEVDWITSNGAHIPIKDGESVEEAILKKNNSNSLTKNAENSKITINQRAVDDFKALKSILAKSDDEIIKLVNESKWSVFGRNGTQDKIIKPILKEIGFDGLPQNVSAEEYEKLKENGELELHRGFMRKEDADQLKNGEMFVGVGVNGSGIYCADDYKRANMYAEKNTGGVTISFLLDKNAKIADGIEMSRMAYDYWGSISNEDKISLICNRESKRLNTLLAISKGYDAIKVGNGDYIILNRTAIIIKE